MTKDEFDRITMRIAEINSEIADLLPEFWKPDSVVHQARIDAALWAMRLDPLFEEHAALAQKLRVATFSG